MNCVHTIILLYTVELSGSKGPTVFRKKGHRTESIAMLNNRLTRCVFVSSVARSTADKLGCTCILSGCKDSRFKYRVQVTFKIRKV